MTEEGAELDRTAHRAVVKRLEELGDDLPPTERELLVTLVSRLLDPAVPHAPGDADDSECPAA